MNVVKEDQNYESSAEKVKQREKDKPPLLPMVSHQLILSPLLRCQALFCTMYLCRGSYIGRGRGFASSPLHLQEQDAEQ